MSVVRVSLCVLLAMLAACDGERPDPPSPREPVAERTPAAQPVREAAVAPEPAVTEPADTPVQAPPVRAERPAASARTLPPSRPVPPASAEPPVAQAPLDLSLPEELLQRLPADEPQAALVERRALLPSLFDARVDEVRSFELGGRLITNERDDEDAWRAVEGAELELRFLR